MPINYNLKDNLQKDKEKFIVFSIIYLLHSVLIIHL